MKKKIFTIIFLVIIPFLIIIIWRYFSFREFDYFAAHNSLPYLSHEQYIIEKYENDLFESFVIIKVNEKKDIITFVDELLLNEFVVKEEVVNGAAPALNLIAEYPINDIPKADLLTFEINCDCFEYFTINNYGYLDGGYLYLVIVHDDQILINYYMR